MTNKIFTIILFGFLATGAFAQNTIEECYKAARENYPLIRQYDLIEKTKEYNLKNASTLYYPQLGITARATYQSEVTEIPIPIFDPIPKDQYQVVAELTQTIWDGGVTRAKRLGAKASADIDSRRLDVDLYALNDRVNNLYFGILMLDEQLKINKLLNDELVRNLEKVESYIASGFANSADSDAVRVEILNNRQGRSAIEAARKYYCSILSAMVGYEITELVKPAEEHISDLESNRPELGFFDAQLAGVEAQKVGINAKSMPRLGAFVQGAYGNPGLNMLKPGFTTYAIGGAQLSWNIGGLYDRKSDLNKIKLQKNMVDNQRETFLFNTNLQSTKYNGEIERLTEQMKEDDQIIRLRGNIKRAAEAKVEGGTMSVMDMLREVTAESAAIQSRAIHEIELIMMIYNLKFNVNK